MSFLESPFNPMATFESQPTMRSISTIDPKLSRTNYYDGRLLKASDLIRDQFYLDERLREVGRVLGQGIVRGLDIELTSDKKLIVKPGIAVSPSGRVLELEETTLEINLLDSAKIYEMNPGFRYLDAGLYAVVIQYAEKGEGSAEIYPKDLDSERGFHFNAYAEGVEFTLAKLQQTLPLEKLKNFPREEIAVYSRSALVRSLLIANPGQPVGIGEDAVALGLLSIEFGEPQWIDKGLLRRPFRHAQALNYLQTDLYNHYQELLKSILEARSASIAKEQFLAKQYFTILPPIGSIPKGAVDPINGYQNYFPENFEVSIAPVRADDINSLLQQSMALEPIDLLTDKDVDIMIAVVLDDANFAFRARQLQHRETEDLNSEFVDPQHLDEMLLENNKTTRDENSVEATVWKKLWDSAKEVFYVRRPVRVAETQVSAVVLATGGTYADLESITVSSRTAEALEDEIDALTEQLADKIDEIAALKNEINKPLDQKLREAKAAEAAAKSDAETAVETAENAVEEAEAAKENARVAEVGKQQAEADAAKATANEAAAKRALDTANEALKNAQEEIKRLKESGGEVDSAELERIKQQLSDTSKQLEELKKFMIQLWKNEKIQLEDVSILSKLRAGTTEEAKNAVEKVLSFIKEVSELQPDLIQLFIIMPARFDNLNWPSLQAIFEKQASEKALDILLSSSAAYPEVMLKISEEFSFPDELKASWKKEASRTFGFVPVAAPIVLSDIKTLKLTQLMPASLNVSTENRALIKELAAADSSLLKPMSQLKVLVDERYESILWESMPAFIESGKLEELVEFVVTTLEKSLPLGLSLASTNTRFKLTAALRAAWAELDFN
jgi:hypothetical protein